MLPGLWELDAARSLPARVIIRAALLGVSVFAEKNAHGIQSITKVH